MVAIMGSGDLGGSSVPMCCGDRKGSGEVAIRRPHGRQRSHGLRRPHALPYHEAKARWRLQRTCTSPQSSPRRATCSSSAARHRGVATLAALQGDLLHRRGTLLQRSTETPSESRGLARAPCARRSWRRQLLERPPVGACGALTYPGKGVAYGAVIPAVDEGLAGSRPQLPVVPTQNVCTPSTLETTLIAQRRCVPRRALVNMPQPNWQELGGRLRRCGGIPPGGHRQPRVQASPDGGEGGRSNRVHGGRAQCAARGLRSISHGDPAAPAGICGFLLLVLLTWVGRNIGKPEHFTVFAQVETSAERSPGPPGICKAQRLLRRRGRSATQLPASARQQSISARASMS